MAEKFRNIVNAPHRAFARARKKIEAMQPETKKGKAARIAGISVSAMFQFLLWATKYVALDNHVLRAAENTLREMEVGKNKSGNDKKVSSFMKRYPNFSAHMLYYLMFVLTIGGGKVAVSHGPVVAQNYKEWRADRQERKARRGTYAEFLDNMQSITPFLIADLIAKEGVHTDPATGLHTPYKDSRGIWTIGFGSTKLKDGTSVGPKTRPITTDEAYELARWHLENEETYFVMYCYDAAVDGLDIKTTNEALGMGSIIYNTYSKLIEDPKDKNHRERFTLLREDFKEYGYAVPDSLVRQRFAQYPITKTESFGAAWLAREKTVDVADKLGNFLAGGNGLRWRRWLEAGLLTGDVTPQMLLDCPVNGMYEFYKYMGKDKAEFFTGRAPNRRVKRETYDLLRAWLTAPVNEKGQSLAHWKKVKDFLPADILALCENEQCKLGNPAFGKKQRDKPIEVQTYIMGYDELYAVAVGAYRAGDYKGAASRFEDMLKSYPDNALLHNDLAATYNNLGRYDDAIAHSREIVRRIGDKSQYGAAQYNAGFAYEQKGDLRRALANYKLAVANGNRRVQADITRVVGKMRDRDAGRTVAFNVAAKNVKNAVDAQMQGMQSLVENEKHMA